MPATAEVRVKGYTELMRAFNKTDKKLKAELRGELRAMAEPVRAAAERLAVERIHNIGDRWSQMRVGVTTKVVYVAPRQRGKNYGPQKRPNLGPLLMEEAMSPALEENHDKIVAGMERFLDELGNTWEQ